MEFCPQLSAFQGVMISADNVHPFSRLTSRGGNEEIIEYIVDSISRFFEDGRYRSQGVYAEDKLATVRKFAFFLILNSDLSILSDMTDMDEIELVIWTIPTIPKCLMCEIFWRLHFEKFVYEAIAYSDPQLASELAFAFLENIKYYTPSECLKKIYIISSALYKLICGIHIFNFYSNTLADKLTMIFNNLQKALNFFTEPPKPERLNSLSKDDQYKYKGNCLNTMLLLVYQCLEEFMTAQELSTISDPIYTLTYMGSVMENVTYRSCDCPSPEILEYLNKCNTALLDKFQELVMGVSVDIFCAWSEFEENGKSVQRNIGELCHKVRTKLLSVSSVAEHPVLGMIQQITCKPEDLNDVIENLDPNSIIERITGSDTKATWLRALINKDNLYENEALLNCVSSHLNVLSDDDCYSFYKNVNYYIKYGPDPADFLNKLIVKLFQHCNVIAQQEILEDHFSNNCFENVMETDGFGNMMTEIFNKLIVVPDADPTAILCLFLQNPEKVYMKIFDLAAENVQQSNIMIKAMKLLAKFNNHFYNCDTGACIIRVTQKALENIDSEVKKFNTIYFICALKNCDIIIAAKLLLLIIMPHIHKSLLKKDIASLNVQCKLLHDAYTLEELLQYRAPMLAMVGQVLDKVRWKINTFIALAPETLQLTLRLQSSLFGTYSSDIPDDELIWLKNKLRNMQPLNMYYYRKLWNPPGGNFVEVTSRLNIQEGMATEQLVTWLSQVICSCTQEEWCVIWESLTALGDVKILDVIHNALSLITLVEQSNRTENSWACILHCYRNFVYAVRYKFFKEPLSDSQVSAIIEKIAVTSNLVEEDSIEDLSTALLPLFAYLAEKRDQYNVDVTQHLTTKLRHSKFSDILLKVFTNGV